MAVDRWYAKTGGAWQRVKPGFVKVAGAWQPVRSLYVKVAGSWQQVYGDADAFVSVAANYSAPGEWEFGYALETATGEPAGGYGTTITVARADTEVQVVEILNAAQYATVTIYADETREYVARLFDKAGQLVDSETFTVAGVPA